MHYIVNTVFSDGEKRCLEFILQHAFPERSMVVDQLNKMKDEDITRVVTPHCWIMEFRPNGVNPGHGPMRPFVDFAVKHGDGIAPTEFTLYERNSIVFELEIYNLNSSAMDMRTIMDGEICMHCNTQG